MKSRNGFLAVMLIWLGACATQHYQSVDAIRTTKSSETKEIIEDATKIDRRFSLLPSAQESKWNSISNLNIPFDQKLQKIKDFYCEGERPKFIPKMKIQIVPPKAPPGVAVDTFTNARKEFVQAARHYLILHFLADASEAMPEVDGNDGFNSDFTEFKTYIMDSGSERKYAQARFSQFVPVTTSSELKEVKAYYQSIGYTPVSPKNEVDSYTWHNVARKNLLVLMDSKSGSAILVPKIAPVFTAKWNDQELTTKVENLFFGELDAPNSVAYHNLSTKTLYSPSDDAWKFRDGQVLHPMHLASVGDLEALRRHFTFLMPEEAQRKQFGKVRDFYGYKNGKLSADKIIQDADQLWEKVLKSQVVEAPMEDGSIVVELNWQNISLFCKYAESNNGLMAK